MADLAVYGILFLAAFMSATLLPAQSEPLLAVLIANYHASWLVLTAASVGNELGSVVNWLVGRRIERFSDRPWFPASRWSLARAERWYRRYGKWSLLMAWAPIVGDPLTVVAGVLREPLPVFLLLMGIGEIGRYVELAAATLGLG